MAELTVPTTGATTLSFCPSCESNVTNIHGICTRSTCSWATPGYR